LFPKIERVWREAVGKLEDLSEEENEIIWSQEAERRDAAWSSSANGGRTAKRVLRNARVKTQVMARVSFIDSLSVNELMRR